VEAGVTERKGDAHDTKLISDRPLHVSTLPVAGRAGTRPPRSRQSPARGIRSKPALSGCSSASRVQPSPAS
jgi:hypothetical protein